ncbi:hypothetical protein NLI96_g7053 [Meripilus lineatus]|uniref:Piwi-domain-containing protein n=1 Tax=Meripilus lineatus TaxID=2056292 RepID=A0AAD5V553_9APHY|nr:hypothetical protein NLI96_g7053 [Physisporinus lineatus]
MSSQGRPGGRHQQRGGHSRGRGSSQSPTPSQSSSTGRGHSRGRGHSPASASGYAGGRGGRGRGGRGRGGSQQVFDAGAPVRVDSRLSNTDALVASFSRLGIDTAKPLRPGWGNTGRSIVVRSNFFPVKIPKDLIIYEYKVTIKAEKERMKRQSSGRKDQDEKKESAGVRARVFELLERQPAFQPYLNHIAHDRSAKLVSSQLLPQPLHIPITFYYAEEDAPRADAVVYNVDIEFVAQLRSNELIQYMDGRPEHRNHDILPIISALNLVLQQHAARTGVRFGKGRYFFPRLESHHLALGLEAKKGFFVSVRPAFKELMVNINVCMTAFYVPGNLASAMREFARQSEGDLPIDFMLKMKVIIRYRGYPMKKTIFKVAARNETPARTNINCPEFGGTISVASFFKQKWNVTLRHADLPLVNLGTDGRPLLVPPELCEIAPDQPFLGTLSETATKAMIEVACNPPYVNADSIRQQGFPALGIQPNAHQGPLAGFGIKVLNEMTTIPARLLSPPSISYRSGSANVRDASWNILNVKFQRGGNMQNWAVLLVQEGREYEFQGANDPELAGFLRAFAKKCRDSGMIVPDGRPRVIETPRLPRPKDDEIPNRGGAMTMIETTIKENLNPNAKPSFLLVLLSGVDKYIYPNMKRLGDVKLGIHTVHMLLRKARDPRKQDQYFSNVALKLNIKLGGINHLLDDPSMRWLRTKKTMIVGIDVTHPSPKSRPGTPSLPAVVASVDDNFVQFPASLGLQRNQRIERDAEEMVQELKNMMCERLKLYADQNRRLPERIIVYRDGVSEGQYDLVIKYELPQIRDAFKAFNSASVTYRPSLSILVCGKRHHARTFATDVQNTTHNGNTPPGLVIDKGITDVYNHDFYLQAHNGLQGHVRPTHYTVIYDENNLDADTIQEGTHRTSYLYARATKAVSLVPPAYYADLACERARYYLNHLLNLSDNRSTTSNVTHGSQEERDKVFLEATRLWGNGVHRDLRESMFYI